MTADLNLDGRADVISWHNERRQVVVYHSEDGGALAVRQVLDLPPIEYFIQFEGRAADVDGDGREDLILFEHGPADFAFFLTQGDGTLRYSRRWRNEGNSYSLVWKAKDVSGDGRADLVFSEDQNKLAVAVQLPDGGFTKDYWPIQAVLPGFTGTEVFVEDYDADGDLDVGWLLRNGQGQARTFLYRNQGMGRFLPGIGARQNSLNGAFLGGVLAPDLTGDGVPDLVVGDTVRGTTAIWAGLENGAFRLVQTVAARAEGELVFVDWNRDGMLEIVAEESTRACYWLNQGRGVFRRPACEEYGEAVGVVKRMARVDLGGLPLLDRVYQVGEALYSVLSARGDLRLAHTALPENPAVTSSTNVVVTVTALTDTFVPPTGSLVLLRDGRELLRFPLTASSVAASGDSGIAAGRAVATTNVKVPFDAGFYTLAMVYEGDAMYLGARTFDRTYSIAPIATAATLAVSAREFSETQEMVATVRVAPVGVALPADGVVSLRRDGVELASGVLSGGAVSFRLRGMVPGPGALEAEYLPGRNFFPSRSAVQNVMVVGAMTVRHPYTLRGTVAPGSLVEFEAESFPKACDFRLSYGPLASASLFAAEGVGAQTVRAVLLPGIGTGVQTMRIHCGAARWEGRATVAMFAPGVWLGGVSLSASRPGTAELAVAQAVDVRQPLNLSGLLTEAGTTVQLTLLGTGWRNASAVSQYVATLNATRLTVASFGPHPTVLGVDLVVVTIPSTFRPPPANTLTPQSRLQMTVGGAAANPIDLMLR